MRRVTVCVRALWTASMSVLLVLVCLIKTKMPGFSTSPYMHCTQFLLIFTPYILIFPFSHFTSQMFNINMIESKILTPNFQYEEQRILRISPVFVINQRVGTGGGSNGPPKILAPLIDIAHFLFITSTFLVFLLTFLLSTIWLVPLLSYFFHRLSCLMVS